MARKKTSKVRVNLKASLSKRLREIRLELFGDHGGPELARRLNLPARTWYNYETGVTVPAEVLLAFIEQTGASPSYLISGEGDRYKRASDDRLLAELSPLELIRRGLEKLERTSRPAGSTPLEALSGREGSEFEAVRLVSMDDLADADSDDWRIDGHVMAYRQWLPNPTRTIAVRLQDDAMSPILPAGSIVAVDRAVVDPAELRGKIVAARLDGRALVRWLDVSGRHLILRPNQPGRDFPLVPVEADEVGPDFLIGQVVWSWSRFSEP